MVVDEVPPRVLRVPVRPVVEVLVDDERPVDDVPVDTPMSLDERVVALLVPRVDPAPVVVVLVAPAAAGGVIVCMPPLVPAPTVAPGAPMPGIDEPDMPPMLPMLEPAPIPALPVAPAPAPEPPATWALAEAAAATAAMMIKVRMTNLL